ncbi:putative transporter [Colletotrichum viniferum]|nr:putative transporter [Colletotrichum viniferum]
MSRRSSNVTLEKMGNDLDPGAEEIETRPRTFSINPDEERKVIRKLDTVIMPLMAIMYFFQYLDKQSINQAAIFGLGEDLRLTGEQFSWAVSLFYLGQLCSEYPEAFLLSRLPIALYVGITIVVWGGVNMCLAAVHDFAGLAATRFFLGFTEGTVSPAFIIITSIWYKRNEHPIRVATWVWSFADHWRAPDFNATVINGFGYSKFRTMLVGMPAGAVNTTTVWASALIPRWLPGTRVYTGIGLCIVPLLGAILLMTLPAEGAEWGIVVSTWLGGCSSALLSTGASIIANNAEGNTKKNIVSAAFFVSYCVGCIVSPQAWTQDDAPRYRKGCISSIAAMVCLILTFAEYVVIVKAKNKSRDAKADAGKSEFSAGISWNNEQAGVDVDSDLTDVQDKGFRYTI